MSKVKLIVKKSNSLDYDEVTDVVLNLQEDHRVVGIVETDFEPDADGTTRASDGLEPVITTDNINHLVGQLLTLVEASTSDPEQRKAARDLYMQTVWSWYTGVTSGLTRTWRYDKGYETTTPRTGVGPGN